MYNNRNRNGGGDRNRGGFRGGRNNRRRFYGNRGGRNKSRDQRIDHSRYIKRAVETAVEVVYESKHKFADFEVSKELKNNIASKNYINPTPIQDQAIPAVLEGKDVIGIANTGTGKTAAFLIPLINKVLKDRNQRVLIIVPTRELAQQINDEFFGFARGLGVYSTTCIGGANMFAQVRALSRQPHFVIGTPGRLKDLAKRKHLNLSKFNNIVLDEVDRMLDMGFIEDIKHIISILPAEKQSLFFSATLPKQAEVLMQSLLKNPVTISVRTRETSDNVDQDVIRYRGHEEKITILHDLLAKEEFKKVIIFGRTKHGVNKLSEVLVEKGHRAVAIHGDKTQSRREKALNQFKTNYAKILVATDVAARGLDISDISHVINYDEPATYEDYIHRIGRTGRANKKGVALTFVE